MGEAIDFIVFVSFPKRAITEENRNRIGLLRITGVCFTSQKKRNLIEY